MDPAGSFQVVIEWAIKTFQTLSPILTIIALVFIVGTKVRKVMRQAKMSKEELWKDKMVRKLLSSLGTGEIMDIIIIITELLRMVPAEELHATILSYYKEMNLEIDMAEALDNLKTLLRLEKDVKTKPVFTRIMSIKDRLQIVEIKNKKRWQRLRRDAKIDNALEEIVKSRWRDRLQRIKSVRQKSRIAEIEEKIDTLTSEQNIIRNRRMRHAIERINETKRNKEKEERMREAMHALHDLFGAGGA